MTYDVVLVNHELIAEICQSSERSCVITWIWIVWSNWDASNLLSELVGHSDHKCWAHLIRRHLPSLFKISNRHEFALAFQTTPVDFAHFYFFLKPALHESSVHNLFADTLKHLVKVLICPGFCNSAFPTQLLKRSCHSHCAWHAAIPNWHLLGLAICLEDSMAIPSDVLRPSGTAERRIGS